MALGYFNNPDGKVIYAKIEPSKELKELLTSFLIPLHVPAARSTP